MDPREREIDLLEQQLMECDDPKERKEIQRDIREIGMDMAEEDAWREEGESHGWC